MRCPAQTALGLTEWRRGDRCQKPSPWAPGGNPESGGKPHTIHTVNTELGLYPRARMWTVAVPSLWQRSSIRPDTSVNEEIVSGSLGVDRVGGNGPMLPGPSSSSWARVPSHSTPGIGIWW